MKNNKGSWKLFFVLNLVFRFLIPLFVFFKPLLTAISAVLADWPDGYLAFRSGLTWKQYHVLDKVFDLWWYIIILIYCKNTSIFWIFLILFIFRSIGQSISLFRQKVEYLLYFPNILEPFFILYLLSTKYQIGTNYFVGYLILLPVFLSALFSLSQEYRLHIKKSYFANFFWKLDLDWSKNKI